MNQSSDSDDSEEKVENIVTDLTPDSPVKKRARYESYISETPAEDSQIPVVYKGLPILPRMSSEENQELLKLLLNAPRNNPTLIASTHPVRVDKNIAFIINLDDLMHAEDLLSDDLGAWEQTKTRSKWYLVKKNANEEVTSVTAKVPGLKMYLQGYSSDSEYALRQALAQEFERSLSFLCKKHAIENVKDKCCKLHFPRSLTDIIIDDIFGSGGLVMTNSEEEHRDQLDVLTTNWDDLEHEETGETPKFSKYFRQFFPGVEEDI